MTEESHDDLLNSHTKILSKSLMMSSNESLIRSRKIKRRGNIYSINDQSNYIDNMIGDLYTETLYMASLASRRAGILKIFTIIAIITIIISGTVSGILTIQGHQNDATNYAAGIISFVISAIQTLLSVFSLEKRSALLNNTSDKLRQISIKLRLLQLSKIDISTKLTQLEEYYIDVDNLDLIIHENTITFSSFRNGTNIDSIESNINDDETEPTNNTFLKLIRKKSSKTKSTGLPVTVKDVELNDSSILQKMTETDRPEE